MSPEVPQLVDHLFRREAGRMVAALTRVLGAENLSLAEDVVQESLVQALRTWPFRGVPENPGGWLMQVAKNRALDLLRREANLARKEEEIRGDPALAGYYPLPVTLGELYARAGDPQRAAGCFREALEMESPEPVRRRIQERVRGLELVR
jgi:predicted RNA polymerase sigma factor